MHISLIPNLNAQPNSIAPSGLDPAKSWHHAPVHRLSEKGAYIVTAGTYEKQPLLCTPERLDFALGCLFECALEFGWLLQAWAILWNHYHFLALSPDDAKSLSPMLAKLHKKIGIEINRRDRTPGRRVIFQYWDNFISYERSYYARLNYVHQNPVRHGIVPVATSYPWCSYAWFERSASTAFFKMITNFKCDKIHIIDDF